jgi:voltage-gated potassium channel
VDRTLRGGLLGEIWRSRIGGASRGLVSLLVMSTVGCWVLGQLHERGLLQPQLPPGERWTLLDCLHYMTITITTVGYGESCTPSGSLAPYPDVRLYTVVVLLVSMVAVAYFLASATAFFVEGDLKRVLERRRMQREIANLSDHFIVCGAGQTGRHIAEELNASGRRCVVIDEDAANIEALSPAQRELAVVGDAARDEALKEAGIERAAGLAAALPDDKDNLFLTISARQLNPKLRIISKAVDLHTRAKLLKAGADGVVSANFIGGLRIASELMRPTVVSFLDVMMRSKDSRTRFAEVTAGGKVDGKTLGEVDPRRGAGLVVIAVKQPGEETFVYNPGPETALREGTVLVVVGEPEKVARLEELVCNRRGTSQLIKTPTSHYKPLGLEDEGKG